jgi:UDP-N-acetylglucosamine:LPS N-acetylglucosamine transferase
MLNCLDTNAWLIITGAVVSIVGMLTTCYLKSRAMTLKYEKAMHEINGINGRLNKFTKIDVDKVAVDKERTKS